MISQRMSKSSWILLENSENGLVKVSKLNLLKNMLDGATLLLNIIERILLRE